MDMEPETRDMAALCATMQRLNDETIIDIDHPTVEGMGKVPLIVLPEGRDVKSLKPLLDEYLDHPDRAKGVAQLTTIASFIAHVNRTKREESAIFADDDPRKPSLVAVYDYNEAETPAGDAAPNFGEHRAVYHFPLSDEWQAWKAVNKQTMDAITFAEFIEDRLVDVMLPEEGQDSIKEFAAGLELTLATPRQLMELSRGLKVNVDTRVENAHSTQSGEARIMFVQENKDGQGQPLRVPGGFGIRIPVFRGDAEYDVPVLLRYRVTGGKITWTMSMYRTDVILRHAFTVAAEKAEIDTKLPLFYGAAEPAAR